MAISTSTSHFTTGHFKLVIDGKPITAYIKSVEGGLIKAQSVEEPVGHDNIRRRHLGTREIEPISIEFGMAGSGWVLDLVDKFIVQRKHTRLNGEIVHADANMVAQYRYEFSNAVVTELSFPKLDGKSKDVALVKVKLQPQDIKFSLGDNRKLNPDGIEKQKQWHTSNFRVTFDNGKDARYVTSVEGMTFKLGHKPMQLPDQYRPDVVPTKVEMPKLAVTMPLLRSAGFIAWYDKAVANQLAGGTADATGAVDTKGGSGYETSGSIEYLDHTMTKVLYTLEMFGIGMESFSIAKSEANAEGSKMAKFDFYVTECKVKSNGSGFQ